VTGPGALRCWLMTAVMVYWAIRLTGNWVYGFPGLHHEDWRYPLLRDGAGRFAFLADLFGIHLFPTLQVFVGLLPAYVAATRPVAGWVWLAWLAFAVGIAAVTLELTADVQMHRFVAARKAGTEAATVMDRGLWRYTRHPNHFGDACTWWGIYLVAAETTTGRWAIVGPMLLTWTLMKWSGAPTIEGSMRRKKPDYEDYIRRTAAFFPWPPRQA
jgi:steroid 5-alpha reductase family enzyme